MATRGARAARVPVAAAAGLVGATFLVVGVLGFVPGITSNYSQLKLAGHMSGAKLLGLFQVSVLHNLVHLLFGVTGVVLARRSVAAARAYLVGGGVVYLVLWLYGLVFGGARTGANFVPLNTADNWLHLLLSVGMIGLGLGLAHTAPVRPQPSTSDASSARLETPHETGYVVSRPGDPATGETGIRLTEGGSPITGSHMGERVEDKSVGAGGAYPGYGDPAGPLSPEPVQPAERTDPPTQGAGSGPG